MRPAVLALVGFLSAAVAGAAELQRALEVEVLVESRLLEAELARYVEVREREREAARSLENQSRRLDEALSGQSTGVDELRRIERAVSAAREAAFAVSREVGELRRQIYSRMDRLAELRRELAEQGDLDLVDSTGLDGFWEVEIDPIADFGLLRLEVDGTLVTGTYRLGNGAQGSLRGTYANGTLRLDRIDTQRGFDASLEGRLDAASGRLQGRWTAMELSGGFPGGGEWSAAKISRDRAGGR